MKGCRQCNHWQGLDEHLDRIDPNTTNQKIQIGLCKRYAPHPMTPTPGGHENGSAAEPHWPRVASDGWCGEYDPRLD